MQKIEKWRIHELSTVLDQLAKLLRKGNNHEWANVIAHFHYESNKILAKKEFDLNELKKLIQNISSCYKETSSFKKLVLWRKNSDEVSELNQEFSQKRTRLFKILSEMEDRSVEYVS